MTSETGVDGKAGPMAGKDVVCKEEVYQIVGAAMEVLNELGHGLPEKTYENALMVELKARGVPFVARPRYEVLYKTVPVGDCVPSLVACNAIVIEARVIDSLTAHERTRLGNCLKATGLKVGLLFNFKRGKLEWERIAPGEPSRNGGGGGRGADDKTGC